MTVSTTTSTITYLGNAATTTFTFPFIGVAASDIEVYYTNSAGVTTLLDPSVYTLVLNAAPIGQLWGIGGSVSYPITGSPVIPIQLGTSISIVRAVPFTQTVSIANQGAFYPQAVEQGLDKLELQIQQIETAQEYSIQTPVTDPSPPNILPSYILRANGYLAFDTNGQPIILQGTPVIPTPGQYATPRKVSTTGTATINVLTSDSFGGVCVYQSSTPVTTLQLPVGYGPFPIFDAGLNSGTYPIKVLPPAGLTILGQAQYYISYNGASAVFYNDGTQIVVG